MLHAINKQFSRAYLPLVLKYFSLIVYITLIYWGLKANSSDPVFLKQLRNTNMGNLIVWSFWWPAIVFLAIFFGRVWCMVCPVEIITSFFARIGLKRQRPGWILSGWGITVFYVLILFVGIQGFAIHRNPFYMALYLLAIAGVSIISGLIFEKNTFCRYLCPVGYMLGLYSRLSFLGWRVKSASVCESCTDKSCIHKNYRYNLNAKSCGVDLYPATIQDNSACIMCAGCTKTCNTYQSTPNAERPNPGLHYIGFASDLFTIRPLKWAEMFFVFIVSGFVISEIGSEWPVTNTLLNYLPDYFCQLLNINHPVLTGMISSIILFIIFPAVFWILPYLVAWVTRTTLTFRDYLLFYGSVFIPVIAAAHLDKAILKTTSRLPYFKYAFNDLAGKNTAQQLLDGSIVLGKNPQWLTLTVSVLLPLIMLSGIFLSYKMVKKINKKLNPVTDTIHLYSIPAMYGAVFLIIIISWRWLT